MYKHTHIHIFVHYIQSTPPIGCSYVYICKYIHVCIYRYIDTHISVHYIRSALPIGWTSAQEHAVAKRAPLCSDPALFQNVLPGTPPLPSFFLPLPLPLSLLLPLPRALLPLLAAYPVSYSPLLRLAVPQQCPHPPPPAPRARVTIPYRTLPAPHEVRQLQQSARFVMPPPLSDVPAQTQMHRHCVRVRVRMVRMWERGGAASARAREAARGLQLTTPPALGLPPYLVPASLMPRPCAHGHVPALCVHPAHPPFQSHLSPSIPWLRQLGRFRVARR